MKKGGRRWVGPGAAPGGWTMLLARSVKQVIAVDNANLAPEVLKMKNVLHIRSLSQNAGPKILE
jgi:23S rRNA C2498 (ribose-2'-O)-methylase RlmM